MSLPTYNKAARRQSFTHLPKGAYVLKILEARVVQNQKNSGQHLQISFDIAEGEYKDHYAKQYRNDSRDDKKWPADAIYRLTIPSDGCADFIWTNYNSFFADLEDSNNGFVCTEPAQMKGKLIGGKFHIEQTQFNGNIYDHTRLKWTCPAEDVRMGRPGQMPKDKLIGSAAGGSSAPATDDNGFMSIPDGFEEELPFV